jgi:predicted ribosomally synthesized peptide with SipW-like signal peptide
MRACTHVVIWFLAVVMGGAGTGDGTNAAWTSEAEGLRKPALRCHVHGGIRDGKQVNIYWHGKPWFGSFLQRLGRGGMCHVDETNM